MKRAHTFKHRLYRLTLEPRSTNTDGKRREFILNLLLAGLTGIGIVALLASVTALAERQNVNGVQSIAFTLIFLLIMLGCRWAVLKGRLRLASYVLIALLAFVATQLVVAWGFMLAQALLAYIMVIVIAGILLGARAGLLWTGIIVILLLSIAFDQTHGHIRPDLSWRQQSPVLIDAIGYALVFCIIGLVSWLSNREIDASLERARLSEAALVAERDSLEVKVADRTRELEQLQLMRIMELERFATFGKVSAALVHELSSPLMAATLSLQNARASGHGRLDRVNKSLAQIERHLQAARMQLRGGSIISDFAVDRELQQVNEIVQPIARRRHVQLTLPKKTKAELRGDAVKFSQIVSNLLMNAIESYPPAESTGIREVTLAVEAQKHGLKLTVHDRGAGISEPEMQRIFEPFYSKKPLPEQHSGLGIGLGIVKQFVEQDFNGGITVASSPKAGTRFTILLKSIDREAARD